MHCFCCFYSYRKRIPAQCKQSAYCFAIKRTSTIIYRRFIYVVELNYECRPLCAYWQFFQWNQHKVTEVLTFPCDYVSLVTPCCEFWWTLIGGFSWLSCLRLLRTPYACWHEGGSGSCLRGFWSFPLLSIKGIFFRHLYHSKPWSLPLIFPH